MTSYIAFLRGINVGGRKVLMKDLQHAFESFGLTNVKTFIASGNVLFDSQENNEELFREDLEEALEKRFGFTIPVILRTREEIQQLITDNPFGAIKIEKGARLQVTLFGNQISDTMPIEKEGFTVVYIGKREVASVVAPKGKTTDLMTFIDKTFGKNSTTRNWNTLQKLLE